MEALVGSGIPDAQSVLDIEPSAEGGMAQVLYHSSLILCGK